MRSTLEIIDSTDNSGPELVSLADLKLELEIDDDDEDDLLNSRITRYSNLVAEACDRLFAFSQAIETFTFDAADYVGGWASERTLPRQSLNLSVYPIAEIDSVTVDGVDLDAADYELDAANGRIWRIGGAWWSGVVVVHYWGGYDLPTHAPATLAQAVIESIRDRIVTADRSATAGIQLISSGEDTVRYFQQSGASTGLSTDVQSMIKTFKRPGLA